MDTNDSSDKKKILILSLIAISVPVVLLLFQLLQPPGQQSAKQIVETTPIPTQMPLPTQNSVPTISPGSYSWNSYEGKTFRIQYPPEWTASPYALSNGVNAIIIKPSVLGKEYYYPQFILQTEPATSRAKDNKEYILAGFGLEKSDVIVEGTPAIKYKGTIPFKTQGNKTLQEPIQESAILLEKNKTLYVIQYEYEGSTVNQTMDDQFDSFIKTFRSK